MNWRSTFCIPIVFMNSFQSGWFDQALARHLVQLIRAGHACDKDVVQHGYHLTRCELGLFPAIRRDPQSKGLEAHYAESDLSVVASHEATIRRLPFNRACAMVLSLLQGEPAPTLG